MGTGDNLSNKKESVMENSISILGSTGSIGRQTVDVAQRLGIKVRAITAGSDWKLLEEQARALRPQLAAVFDEKAAAQLKTALADTDIKVVSGMEGLCEAAALPGAGTVVTAVSGAVGLEPTLCAIAQGKRIALANKETLVCAGETVMSAAREMGAEIIPVDSEHSAIFQCLAGCGDRAEVKRILLTGSGGPFRGWDRQRTKSVTPAQAVCHPNWSMGAKISVDSATMMNKGLEFIEAMHLFAVEPEKIRVLVHPQSIVHSMVEFADGSVVAQMGVPDMRIPIQYALTYPRRCQSPAAPLELTGLSGLTFEDPDMEKVPCLALAIDCAKKGGTAPAVMSAANEVAVSLFLTGKIGFNDIFECVDAAVGSIDIIEKPSLGEILSADKAAREFVSGRYGN